MFNNRNRIPLSEPVLRGKEWSYLKQCLDTGWLSSAGKFVGLFENSICQHVGVKYAVACVNGTAGLHLALRLCKVENNNEVIVPTLTFIASINAVKYLNAEPVFMDCDDFMNIDVEKLETFCSKECALSKNGLRNKKSGRLVKAVIAVHVFGNPCDMEAIMRIARKYRLKVVEDAAESLGSTYSAGKYKNKHTGTIGDIGVYSFNANKIITTGGGGMLLTNNNKLAKKAKYLINQAKDDEIKYIHNEIGYNFRMTNLQAALGLAQMDLLKQFIKIKKANYYRYSELLQVTRGLSLLKCPPKTSPNYWFYSLVINQHYFGKSRDIVMKKLAKANIESRPVWQLNHLQKPYLKNQAYMISKAKWFWQRVLNIPCSVSLKTSDINRVVETILG